MGVAGREAAGRGAPLPAGRGGDRGGARYAQGGRSSMAEDESDQESERLSEELEALVTPGLPAGLPALLNSQYYCRRFCQVSAAPPPRPAPRPSPPRAGVGCGGARTPQPLGVTGGHRGAGAAAGQGTPPVRRSGCCPAAWGQCRGSAGAGVAMEEPGPGRTRSWVLRRTRGTEAMPVCPRGRPGCLALNTPARGEGGGRSRRRAGPGWAGAGREGCVGEGKEAASWRGGGGTGGGGGGRGIAGGV